MNNTTTTDWAAAAVADLPAMVTTDEALGVLRMSRRNLYRLVRSGRIQAVRGRDTGSARLLIPRTVLEGYLRSLEVAA